ncbi:hypothetical protein B0O99DRAFT_625929 [Bisporella sp. PMI_857]|nr:hypothetical protein B0O99DRAFT_625929 [Bisporella sp. PMI_857]
MQRHSIYANIEAYTKPSGLFTYYTSQAPHIAIKESQLSPQSLGLTMQLLNLFLLVAAVAVICCWTTDARITKRYLIAIALADYGHIWAAYKALGSDYFWNIAGWNLTTCGNVGVSVLLNLVRWATVLGLFGEVGVGKKAKEA